MEISFLNKNKSVQPQQPQDSSTDPARNISTEENKKYVIKNKVDSAEISSNHTGAFDDKKLMISKSAILYDVSADTSKIKVEELKKQIENGEYKVPTSLLADAILKK